MSTASLLLALVALICYCKIFVHLKLFLGVIFIQLLYFFNYLAINVEAFGATGAVRVNTRSNISMKIFDWKKRAAFQKYEVADGNYFSLN